MIAELAFAAAQAPARIPVPARPSPIMDHRIACDLFGPHARLGAMTARVDADTRVLARVTIGGDLRALPLPANASAFSSDGMVGVKSRRERTEYDWVFRVPQGALFADGTVIVTARDGLGPIRTVATGICSVASTRAAQQ